MTQVGNVIVLGGDFTAVSPARSEDTLSRSSIVAFDASTGAILASFAPILDGPVYSLAPGPRPDTVYVGGGFSTVNGAARKSLALLELSTGALSSGWRSPYMNGLVRDMSLVGGRLLVGGTFTKVGTQDLGGLASFSPTTGVWDPWMTIKLEQNHNWTPGSTGAKAPVGVEDFDLTDDGRTLVVVGNFRTAGGLARDQIALFDMSGTSPSVRTDWRTTRFSSACSSGAFDSWVRDVDVAPDGTYFAVATTGGPHPGTLCDTGSRWELGVASQDAAPTWTSESGGDTLLSIAVTGAAVYIGGHQRWMNNPDGRDGARPGAVPRPGLVGLDPQSGIPVSWNPGRNPRGVGAGALLATSAGLWVGSDTEYIGNFQLRRPRIAFFPVSGGTSPSGEGRWTLPANLYQGGRTAITGDASLTRRWHTGTSIETTDVVGGSGVAWNLVRGAFAVDGMLYYGASDGLLYRRAMDTGGNFGASQLVDPYNDPYWSTVGTGSGTGVYRGSRPSLYGSELASVTGMAYLSDRILYTLSGSNQLFWRWFSPDSGIVGPRRNVVAGAVLPTDVRGLFVADDYLWYAHGSGNLTRHRLSGVSIVPGTTQVMGGPALDGIDWRSRALFLGPGPTPPANVPPEARFSVTCTQLSCAFDGSSSVDPDGTIASYTWTFGDGASASGAATTHTFPADGAYTVQLSVRDNRGATTDAVRDLIVSAQNVPPSAVIEATCTDLSCVLSGSASTDSDGSIGSYEWTFGDGASGTGATVTHSFPATGTYHVSLTVQDNQGARTTRHRDLSVTAAPASIDFHGSAATQATFTRASVAVPGQAEAGDVLLLFATVNSVTPTVQPPAGWTEIGRQTAGTMVTVVWSRTATASDVGSSISVGLSQTAKLDLQIVAYGDVDEASPVSAAASRADLSATDTHTSPTVTVPDRDSWVVTHYADKSSSTTAWTSPPGMATRSVSYGSGSGYITSLLIDGDAPVAAGTAAGGLVARTNVAGSRATSWSVVLKPAAG